MVTSIKSRALALGGVMSAMALAVVLSAPAAQAAPASAPTVAPVTNAAFVTDHRDDHRRGDRCWRFWGGRWHFVCGRSGPIFNHHRGDRDDHRGDHRGDHGPIHRGDHH